ncbi:Ig-like domain-containing protein [Solirubrobacter soli]|uniref:Ig-like domain-containing protein n=1 Tax=Solirubrobacter soli TaxID=363832 RepID=UPI0012F9B947|nr:Ig-like domain-containing protein [Solirubrobacter soli]
MRYRVLPVLVSAGVLCFAQSAYAGSVTVDDDHADCPAAGYTSVQAAVDAAAPGDTVIICPGQYVEGTGEVGTNALTISKSLTLKGAGADLVTITPKSSGPAYGRIMEATPDIRNGLGDVIAIVGTPSQPVDVDVSGVTVDGWDPQGRPVAVEAGIVFLDAKGSVNRSHVTNVVTSEGAEAYNRAGGYRGTQPGIGIAQVTNALYAPVDGARRLEITRTRVDKYNKIGILIDGAINDAAPFTSSGTVDWGVITASQVIGRTQCINYQGTGNCGLTGAGFPGPDTLTTGPLFGQDGVRITAGSYATIESSTISQNLVLGTGAPVRNSATNNANLSLGSGVRYVGAKLTSFSTATSTVIYSKIANSNIVDNSYGVMNLQADGVTPQTGLVVPVTTNNTSPGYGNLLFAENNWWGLYDTAATNPGPAIAPTTNPNSGENPVTGTSTADPAQGGTTSNSVDFFPYRNGNQTNPSTGQWPVLSAPIPVNDAAPTVSLSSPASAAPGATITLTASPADDFGVKRVRFTSGTTTLGTASLPPYTQSVVIPAEAACNSTRPYGAVATDSLGQTAAATTSVTVSCPAPGPTPTPDPAAAPTLAFQSWPSPLRGSGNVAFAVTAPAGLKSVVVFLGSRQVCSITAAPYSCTINATGADVGGQALRAVVTDVLGRTAEVQRSVTVAKFTPDISLSVAKKSVSGGKVRRTVSGKLKLPSGVTAAQGCNGSVNLVITRDGRSLLNQQLKVSKTCTFSASVTAAKSNQSFSASARFGGNAVLATANETRRFS